MIHQQWRTLGLVLSYAYEKFTLDKTFSLTVTETFLAWYKAGLIYEATKMINWDPQLKTALSDIEVILKPTKSNLYYCVYQQVNSNSSLVVATSRPETIFVDQCLFVHPDDSRYFEWHNKQVINPLTQAVITVLTDSYVDPDFGTGVLKCTPGHDFNDYELGLKHHLKAPSCLDETGKMNHLAGAYQGLDRFICREKVAQQLAKTGQLKQKVAYTANIGYSERSNVIVEPFLSKQWFLKTKLISKAILQDQKSQRATLFFPSQMAQVLERWLNNIEDWCLSRQIWWGHQLPVYRNQKTKAVAVQSSVPTPKEDWSQTTDVLDTWFSSGLWPLVATGWLENKPLFQKAFPTQLLVCGSDIIFFWVARMMMQSKFLTNQLPFQKVVIHGLIRDENGFKMSKSLNNGVDPQELFNTYGIDAVRLFLNTSVTLGNDLKLQPKRLKENWNFLNKLWNIARYVKQIEVKPSFLSQKDFDHLFHDSDPKLAIHRWILFNLKTTIEKIEQYWGQFALNHVYEKIYHFLWDDFAAIFVEFSKNLDNKDQQYQRITRQVLGHCFLVSLQLLHPLVPFVTEYLWSQLEQKDLLINSSMPQNEYKVKPEKLIDRLLMINNLLRRLQTNWSKELKQNRQILFSLQDDWLAWNDQKKLLFYLQIFFSHSIKLIKPNELVELKNEEYEQHHFSGGVIFWLKTDINYQNEQKHLAEELGRLKQELNRSSKLMNNKHFLDKANPAKVALEKAKYAKYQKEYDKINLRLIALKKLTTK